MLRALISNFALPLSVACLSVIAEAQVQQSFVASYGNDANDCSRTLPCRSFATAIAFLPAKGEVIVIDAAGYGTLTISQSISIISPPGVYAGVSSVAGDAITINVPSGQGAVLLRNLTVTGLGGLNGIAYRSGDELLLDHMRVAGFTSAGVFTSLANPGRLTVKNSIIRNNGFGIAKDNATTTALVLTVTGTLLTDNVTSVDLWSNYSVLIADTTITAGRDGLFLHGGTGTSYVECVRCTIAALTGSGVKADQQSLATLVTQLTDSTISKNLGNGIAATNGAVVRVSDVTIANNGVGIAPLAGGSQAVSWGDNRLVGNGTNGAFSSTVPKK